MKKLVYTVFALILTVGLVISTATTVLAINTSPVAVDDAYATIQDTILNVGVPGVLANDYDPDGDPIVVSSLNPASHGTVVLFGDGHFHYTPHTGFAGSDSFRYYISDGQGGAASAYVYITVSPAIEEVDIDVKPSSFPNSINLRSKGVIPVAILTTETFDATTVDPTSVEFAGALPLRWAVGNVDDDGDLDLILHFKTQETGIATGDIEATLTGTTFGGQAIVGTDSVRTVPVSS